MQFKDMLEAYNASTPATDLEWQSLCERIYKSAYRLGLEAGYKQAQVREETLSPEQLADIHEPDWRETPAVNLSDIGAFALDSIIKGDARNEAS